MDCPSNASLPDYTNELKIRGVTKVVRLCEDTYDKSYLEDRGVGVCDMYYPDGGIPPPEILSAFLGLLETEWSQGLSLTKEVIEDKRIVISESAVIAVHCVAGLGRAPVLVAVALIEAGLAPLDAVDFIRKCRRGAFNAHQLKYLIDNYRKRSKSKGGGFLGMQKERRGSPKEEVGFLKKMFLSVMKPKEG